MESSEASKVFIRRKKSIIHVDRNMGRLKEQVPESHPHGHFFYRAFLLGFFWPIILICLVHIPIQYISRSSHVYAHISQPGWNLPQKPMGNKHPFGLQGAFLCICGWGGLLTSRMRYGLGRVQPPLLIVLLFSSWSSSTQE